jgi:DNA-binding NarL/FixJ family response regulator
MIRMKRIYGFSALALILFAMLVVIDTIKSDEPFVLTNFALDVFEKALLALAVVATAYVALETRTMRRERTDLLNDLSRVRGESDRWRTAARVHIDGLGRAISEQFKIWKLSDSEADVALLMLKGLTQKEIAHLRGSEEGTVRQQAIAVYRKSGLSNRSELGAFFLEDLLSPNEVGETQPGQKLKIVQT